MLGVIIFESHTSTSIQIDFINSRNLKTHFVDNFPSKIEVVIILASIICLSKNKATMFESAPERNNCTIL